MTTPPIGTDIGACVFDAYGTLFDVNAAAERCRDDLAGKADELATIWRLKQLQYTWLRSLMERYVDFWQVTGDGLDYAMAALGIDNPALRDKLMALYLELDAYPEVVETLTRLRAGGMKTAILSNGSPNMLDAAVNNAGIKDLLDAVISVDALGVYKPDPSVYRMAVDEFELPPQRICFMSSNSWDAMAGSEYGFKVAWVNRFKQPREGIPGNPNAEILTLAELPALLGL